MKIADSMDNMMTARLDELRACDGLRQLHESAPDGVHIIQRGVRYLSFCSNDYLGLGADGGASALLQGAGASRLVTGNHPAYALLETELARMKATQAALVCGSGYLANIGVMQALVGKGDLVILDKLSHACMIDGARLSGAAIMRFRHNDMAHLAQLLSAHRGTYRRCIIATETVFSMDGDQPDLAMCVEIAATYDAWLYTDDAHGFGLPGMAHNPAHIQVGTLSKAAAAYGGYVAGSQTLIDYLVNMARPVLFSTGLPEALVHLAYENIARMQAEPERSARVMTLARRVTSAMGMADALSPIIPIMIGDNTRTLAAQAALKAQGILVAAIRPPTVQPATARLRLSLSAAHSDADIDTLVTALHNIGG